MEDFVPTSRLPHTRTRIEIFESSDLRKGCWETLLDPCQPHFSIRPPIWNEREKEVNVSHVSTTESFNQTHFAYLHTLGQETRRKSSLEHARTSCISIFCPIAGKSRGKEESLWLTREPRTAYLAEADHFRKFAELCNKLYSGLVARRDKGGG